MKVLNLSVPATTPEQIKSNIDARKAAEELVSLAGVQPPRFWEILRVMACQHLGMAIAENAMSEEEAVAFEREPIPFGMHEGTPIGEVKSEYLIWLTEGDRFTRKLKRYVSSKVFARRQEEEG